jgi:competence protein ComGC
MRTDECLAQRLYRPALAFSLVEILVVVSIITVLLAIALPVASSAIYRAEQLRCATNLKAIASGVQTYAVGHNRYYPYRAAIHRSNTKVPNIIAQQPGPLGTGADRDDRPYLKDHVELKSLLDPFNDPIDLSPQASGPNVHVFANYALWWGMFYSGHGGGMTRMGGRMSFNQMSFSLLASDWDAFETTSGEKVHASHYDHDSVLTALVEQSVGRNTRAIWYNTLVHERGAIDTNYVYEDGSVQHLKEVRYDEAPAFGLGERTVRVPLRADDTFVDPNWIQVPRGQ